MNKFGAALSAAAVVFVSAAHAGPSEAMAFAIGACAAQADPQARLACYDQLAAKLRAGEAIGPQASVTPALPTPVPSVPMPAPAYESPPAVASAPAPVTAPPAPVPSPAQTFGQSQPEPEQAKKEHAWYDVGNWFGSESNEHRTTTGSPQAFGAENLPPPKAAPGAPSPEPLDEISAKVTSVAFNSLGRFTVTLDNGQVWRQLEGDTGTPQFGRKGNDTVSISRGILGSYNLVVDGHHAMFKVKRLQ